MLLLGIHYTRSSRRASDGCTTSEALPNRHVLRSTVCQIAVKKRKIGFKWGRSMRSYNVSTPNVSALIWCPLNSNIFLLLPVARTLSWTGTQQGTEEAGARCSSSKGPACSGSLPAGLMIPAMLWQLLLAWMPSLSTSLNLPLVYTPW